MTSVVLLFPDEQIASILQAKGPGVLGSLTAASVSDGLVDGIAIALEIALSLQHPMYLIESTKVRERKGVIVTFYAESIPRTSTMKP